MEARMNRFKIWVAGASTALVLATGTAPARAGASFDFLFSMDQVGDDHQYFLNLAVGNYGYGRAVLEPVLPRLRYVEVDLPVVLFLANESGRGVDSIVALRARGMPWSAVFVELGVPLDVLFAGIDQDPGPPYGRAWGHWRNNPRGVRLDDGEVASLVEVQIGSRLAGVRPGELARGRGGDVAAYVAERKGRPYRPGNSGHDKGKEKHRPHDHLGH